MAASREEGSGVRKTVFLYSGEGTSNSESGSKLVRTSRHWPQIERVLREELELDLEQLWREEIGKHRCPYSPLLTVICEICLADIWAHWGYRPDVVIGHSLGEVSAAFEAGYYSLEEILPLTFRIGQAAAKLEGVMAHGTLSKEQLDALPVALSSRNFRDGGGTHVTVSGSRDDMAAFLKANPGFSAMRPAHPWHHPDYRSYRDGLETVSARSGAGPLFVSGVSASFQSGLKDDHWQRWLSEPIDFIGAMDAISGHYSDQEIDVIEIGFHPVLEKCCEVFASHRYVSSMYRGENETGWALFQRRKLDPQPLLARLRQAVDSFRPGVDLDAPLAYQGFTSRTFVELTAVLAPYFPGLAPQDFYRYKSVKQLTDRFGAAAQRETAPLGSMAKREVVIAGMSCRFPAAAQTPAQFWRALRAGEDQVRPDPPRGAGEAGFLTPEVSRFDHGYFGIPDAEARSMDPQQMLALELAEMLWRDAGIDPKTLDRRRVGVYIGVWNTEYRGDRSSVYYPTGTNPSIVASRISHQYDLRGPSWVCNTACSSSLVAVHYACKDIEAGRVDFAIAGGVNMILGDTFTESMRRSGFLSTAQRCKAFDDSADGYVRAEGGGLVLLAAKNLVDRHYAAVRGSAINQNGGRTQTITAPHPEAQEELILDACGEAGIEPGRIAYVECHGTGTRIGDPIEFSALQNTVARDREGVCYLGSVKSNIGHMESAAGIAGLIKSVLILSHGRIPANLHFSTPNKFIDFRSHRLSVVAEETPIDPQSFIGVSSFGFGGANAHIVISGVDEQLRKAVEDLPVPFDRARALPLSAFSGIDEDQPAPSPALAGGALDGQPRVDIRSLVEQTFFDVTNVKEIDPGVELSEQGLDSMGATQFVTTLQERLGMEVDTDLLFDHPLVDQFVEALEKLRADRAR
jgi:acyl transferase domain-containing protein/acyl carrier protein